MLNSAAASVGLNPCRPRRRIQVRRDYEPCKKHGEHGAAPERSREENERDYPMMVKDPPQSSKPCNNLDAYVIELHLVIRFHN